MSIHAKLLAAQKSISGIAKTGTNEHFGYSFFEEREVLRVAREALNDAGLVFFVSVDGVTDQAVTTSRGKEELLTDVAMTCTIFDAESGESVEGGAVGRGQDGQDKGVNKAIVAGVKYWLLKALMIPTDDDTERTENSDPGSSRGHAPEESSPRAPAPSKPTGDAFEMACPACSGEMWDNRAKKASGQFNPKSPDFACKDKDGCGEAVWLDGWAKDLTRDINAALAMGSIDNGLAENMKAAVETKDPRKMDYTRRKLREMGAGQ